MRPPPWPMSSPPDGCRQKLANQPGQKKRKMATSRSIPAIGLVSAAILNGLWTPSMRRSNQPNRPNITQPDIIVSNTRVVLLLFFNCCFQISNTITRPDRGDKLKSRGASLPDLSSLTICQQNGRRPANQCTIPQILKDCIPTVLNCTESDCDQHGSPGPL